MDTRRNLLKKKQRVVIKIGSSSLQHTETGDMDYIRLEVLVRELCNLKNQGKDVVLVSSGAIAQGKKAVRRGLVCCFIKKLKISEGEQNYEKL